MKAAPFIFSVQKLRTVSCYTLLPQTTSRRISQGQFIGLRISENVLLLLLDLLLILGDLLSQVLLVLAGPALQNADVVADEHIGECVGDLLR